MYYIILSLNKFNHKSEFELRGEHVASKSLLYSTINAKNPQSKIHLTGD